MWNDASASDYTERVLRLQPRLSFFPVTSGTDETAPGSCRALRSDARRNQAKVLAAAAEVFAEYGLSAPVDEIARRAGVGPGTIYRHFPTKAALGEAVVMAHMTGFLERARQLSEGEDACSALFTLVRELVQLAVQKRDLVEELSKAGVGTDELAAPVKREMESLLGSLWARAQSDGRVRSDINFRDVSSLISATCMAASQDARCSSERLVSVMCAGLQIRPPLFQ